MSVCSGAPDPTRAPAPPRTTRTSDRTAATRARARRPARPASRPLRTARGCRRSRASPRPPGAGPPSRDRESRGRAPGTARRASRSAARARAPKLLSLRPTKPDRDVARDVGADASAASERASRKAGADFFTLKAEATGEKKVENPTPPEYTGARAEPEDRSRKAICWRQPERIRASSRYGKLLAAATGVAIRATPGVLRESLQAPAAAQARRRPGPGIPG